MAEVQQTEFGKQQKGKISFVDMTPLVDVAFLLLSFFILTTHFRSAETFPIDTPTATSAWDLGDAGIVEIRMDDKGRVSLAVAETDVKQEVLRTIEQRYGFRFSGLGARHFLTAPDWALPVTSLPAWLNQGSIRDVRSFPLGGIPINQAYCGCDLGAWIDLVRTAARKLDKSMVFALKGDLNARYPLIEEVIGTLQEEGINRFCLVTKLETDPRLESPFKSQPIHHY